MVRGSGVALNYKLLDLVSEFEHGSQGDWPQW